jgi:hypothetical protein
MDHKFCLREAPTCLNCQRPCDRQVTSTSNTNGNAGRPYYACFNPSHGRKFARWADNCGYKCVLC